MNHRCDYYMIWILEGILIFMCSRSSHPYISVQPRRSGQFLDYGHWLTIREVAEKLQISRDTVERWIHGGHVKAIDVSKNSFNTSHRPCWRINSMSLDDFLQARLNQPAYPKRKYPRRNKSEVIEFIK